jgi:hypothetical protein
MNRALRVLALAALLAAALPLSAAGKGRPSRPASKGCKWEKLSDPAVGIEAWVERCDYGYRKIDLFLKGSSIFQRYSDGGEPDALVDVLDLKAGETSEAGVKRIFAEHTEKALAVRCVMKPYRETKSPSGVRRYTFVPDAALQKELDAKRDPNEVGDPSCGDWGDAPDGIQYFETQPKSGARKVLFVRVGQDEPLFDEQTLTLLPAK